MATSTASARAPACPAARTSQRASRIVCSMAAPQPSRKQLATAVSLASTLSAGPALAATEAMGQVRRNARCFPRGDLPAATHRLPSLLPSQAPCLATSRVTSCISHSRPLQLADTASLSLALGGGAAIAALGAALVITDPQKRRAQQMQETGGNELEAVKKYFDTAGFERWNKIYGETDEVNKVRLGGQSWQHGACEGALGLGATGGGLSRNPSRLAHLFAHCWLQDIHVLSMCYQRHRGFPACRCWHHPVHCPFMLLWHSLSRFALQVQLDIRNGHAQTVDKVLRWLDEGEPTGVLLFACCPPVPTAGEPKAHRKHLQAWPTVCFQ